MKKEISIKGERFVLQNGDVLGKDGLIYCRECNTPRVVIFGKIIVRCLCECQSKEQDNRILLEISQRKNKMMQEKRDISIPHKKWQEQTFESSDNKEDKVYKAVKTYVDKFYQMLMDCKGIIFYGQMGSGKTYYQCCIANALFTEYKIAMRNSAELITIFDSGRQQEISKILEELSEVDLFLLDDFGSERCSDFAISKLYQIINTRINSGKPMIISTNISMQNMKNETNMSLKRIYERLFENCLPIKMDGNRRIKKSKDNFFEMQQELGLT